MPPLQQVRPGPDREATERSASRGTPSGAPDGEARLSQCLADFVDSERSVAGFVLRRPRSALSVLRGIRALPRLDALLPPGPEAAAVKAQMMRNPTSRRFTSGVSAVLALPSAPGTYAEGHERATLRRKVRAATKKDVTVRLVEDADRAALLALADRHEQHNEREQYRTAEPDNADLLAYATWFAAYDAEGRPVALAVTPVAGRWATLRYFRTLEPGPVSSDARYLMSQVVAEALGERGVRYLVDTARPHWLPNGLRHFQRMVGFRLVRVGPARITD